MLPDLVNMLAIRVLSIPDSATESGVRLHYRTDVVFHAAPTFLELVAQARRRLGELGLARGSARAAAHVGVELLLDSQLAKNPLTHAAVGRALGAGADQGTTWICWPDATSAERFRRLAMDLLGRDLGGRDGTADASAFRVARALGGRTRLELDTPGRGIVARWASESESSVQGASAAILEEVARGLERTAMAAE
jgi:hypothetical protein